MSKELLREYIAEVLDGFGNFSTARDGVAGNLRYDVPTTGHTGASINADEEADEAKVKRAATVLIIADDGKVLAVSRRDDPTAFGLPGGKVDDNGESVADAAARELQEETGLTATDLKPVFTRQGDADGYTTTTFVGKVSGQIDTSEEGVVRWVDPEVLFNGPFGEYNKRLFRHLGRL